MTATHFLAAQEHPDQSFDQPWQVEAFATVVSLTRRGVFGWPEWSQTLAQVARDEPAGSDETVTAAYYRQWTTALERLLDRYVALDAPEVDSRVERWREAYLGTPHGHPVELANYVHCTPAKVAHHEDDHDHMMISRAELLERAKPITIDPARTA